MTLLCAGVLMPPVLDGHSPDSLRDARRGSDLKNVQAALESFHRTHGEYPSTESEWRGDMTEYGGFGYDAGNSYVPGLVPNFLPSLPKDPDSQYPTHELGYMYRSDGVNYKFVLRGTPDDFSAGNPYLDPVRDDSWQASSSGGLYW